MSKKVTGEDWIVESIKDVPFEDLYEWGLQLGSGATAKVNIFKLFRSHNTIISFSYLHALNFIYICQVFQCKRKADSRDFAVKVIEKKIDRKIVKTEIGALLR